MAKSRLSEILQGGQPVFNNPIVSGDRPVIQGGEPNKWDVGLTRLTPDRNELRADNQGFLPMWGNAIVQSAAEIGLGTLEGVGYLADAETIFNYQKQAEEGFGNWFSDAMRDAKEAVGEEFPVYAGQDAQGFAPHKAEWWATHAPSIASTLSLLIPTSAVVKGLGTLGKASKIIKEAQTVESLLAKGIKLEKAAEIVQKQQAFREGLKGVTGAITSRYMENTLEARDTYETAYQKALKEGKTEDEASLIAGKAASNTWQANWINVATDIMQYTAIFRGANALKAATGKKENFTKELFKTMLSEAGEEGVQYGIQKESVNSDNPSEVFSNIIKNFPGYFQDPEFLNSITLGAVGGGIFHAAGTGIEKLANKLSSNYQNTKQAEQAFQKGVNSQVAKSRFIPLMTTLKEKGVDEARNLISFAEQDEEADQSIVQKMKDYVDFYEANQKVLSGKPNAQVELERTMWQKFNKDQIEEISSEVSALSQGLTEGQLSKMKLDILKKSIKADGSLIEPLRKRYEKEIKDFGDTTPLPKNNPNQNILNSKLTELVKLEVEENKYSKPVSAKKQVIQEQGQTLEELLQEQPVIAEGIPNVEPIPTVPVQPADEETAKEINNRGANKVYEDIASKGIDLEIPTAEEQKKRIANVQEKEKASKEQPIQAEEVEGYFPTEEPRPIVSVSDSGTGGNPTKGSTVTDIEKSRQEEIDFVEQKVKEGKTSRKDANTLIKSINNRYDEKVKNLESVSETPQEPGETEIFPEFTEEEFEPEYPDQKKIDEETEYVEQEVLESDSVDEDAKVYGYNRIKNGWNVLAHLSRNYEVRTEIGEDGIVYVNREDLNNLLNKPEEQRILDFSKYPVGTKLTFEVVDDAEIEMYVPGTKEVTTWGALKSTVDYTSNVPIAVKDEAGNVLGYIHSTDWMQESNIYGDIQENIAKVQELRQHVIDNKGSVATSIQRRTKGKFFKVKGEKGKVSELQPASQVAVWNGQKWLGVGKDVNIINKQPKTGFTYTVLQASPDAHIAVPIDTGKLNPDIQRTLKSAILIYTAPTLTPALREQAQRFADAGFDVRSREGFEKLFNLFLFNRNVGEAYRRNYDKKVYKSPLHAWAASMIGDPLQPGTVTSDKSHFNTYENSVDFTIGDVGFSLSRNRNIKQDELNALDNALEKAFLNVNAKMLGGEVSIPTLSQDGTIEVKQIEYQDFVKENSFTNIAQQKVGDTYISFIQPVVTLDTSFLEQEAVEAIHPEAKKEEEKPTDFIIKEYDKVWRDGTNSNKAKSFALKSKPNEIFELVKDKEEGYYSIHFKTSGKESLTEFEKQQLISIIASNIPIGAKLSTWGEVTKGGFAGLERFTREGFVKTSETRIHSGNTIPVYIKQTGSNVASKFKSKKVVLAEDEDYLPSLKKEGVDFVFQQNPELATIGNQQEYSQYLDTIFSDSKVKDIVYHGSSNIFLEFDFNLSGRNTGRNKPVGVYFTANSKIADYLYQGTYQEKIDASGSRYSEKVNTGKVYAAILNLTSLEKGVNFIHEKDAIDEYDTEGLLEYDAYIANNKSQIHILGSTQDIEGFEQWKQFKELSSTFDLLPALTNKDVKEIAKESANILIPGLTPNQQTSTVVAIAEDVVRRVLIDGKMTHRDFKFVMNEWREAFIQRREEEESAANKEHFNHYINNWHTVENLVFSYIKSRDGVDVKNADTIGENEDYDDSESFEKSNYSDEAIFTIDNKDSMSGKLKRFFSFVPVHGDAAKSQTYLGLDKFVPFDEIIDTISNVLSGKDFNVSQAVETIRKDIDRPWAEVVAVMLENASEELQNQFITNFRRHNVEMEFVLWSGDDKNGYKLYIKDSNSSSLANLINEQWYENMKISGLLTDEGDDYVVDRSVAIEALKLVVKMKVRKSDEDLKQLLGYFGIQLSDKTLEDLKRGGLRIGNRRFRFHELFNPEDGALFNEMANILRSTKSGKIYLSVDGIIDRGGSISYGVAALAKLEAKNTRLLVPTSFRTADKTIFSYTVNKFLTNRMRDLKSDSSLREHLKSLPFHKNSVWYEQMQEQPDTFLFKYMDVGEVLKKFKGRSTGNNKVTKLPPSDHEFVKMALFQQRGQKYGTFFYPTTSDKSTVMSLRVPKQEITLNEDGGVSNETIDKVYQQVVLPEAQRIWYFEGKTTGIEGFDTGKGQFFFMPELNNIPGLFTSSGVLVDFRVNEEARIKVKQAIEQHLNNLVSDKLLDWKNLDVASKHDSKYYKGISYHDKSRFAAADYAINYLLFNSNVYMTFIGDPALYHKRTKENKKTLSKLNQYGVVDRNLYDYTGDSKETFVNVGKRLAADVAPGYEGNIDGTYKVLLLKDRKVFSQYIASYAKSLDGIDLTEEDVNNLLNEDWREENEDWIQKNIPNSIPYFEANGTDAQEFTTWQEHLNLLWAYGKITEKEKVQIEEAINKGKDLNEEQLNVVMQPMKPVQVAMVNADGFQRRVYIKSASIPLIPQLTANLEIDKLRQVMETNGINRAAFGSAVKVGNIDAPLNIWNTDGTISDKINIEEQHVLELDRSAFRIQQEAPYKESKSAILAGSQEKKLLFTDHLETTGFMYDGKEYKGSDLEAIYRQHYKQWFDIELDAFLEEIEYKEDGTFNTNKLRSMLLDEARKRNYDINTQLALKELDNNGQFRIPVWAMPSSSRMEGVITSLIDNRVRKQKINGGSAVLGSPEGFITWENASSKIKSSIVFTDSWDGKLKPQRIENGVVKPAQVIAPWKFRGKDGKFLNITDYIVDGKLDLSKFEDKSLLQMFSYRIPTQGLNSMNIVEVVGYSPKLSGDMLITSAESTVQIGEDYDFDKRYNYWYNTFVDSTGKILKVTDANIDSVVDFILQADTDFQDALAETFGVSIPGYSQEEIDQDKKVKDAYRKAKVLALQNKIIDIHYSVMSNPKTQKSIVEPLGYGKLKELAPKFEQLRESTSEQFSPLSDTYQRKKFFIASSGKAGVGVFSLDSTMNTLLQGKDVKLTDMVDGTDVFKVKFGSQVSHGELSKVKTIKGERNKSSVISAFQSAAVDNERMQILGQLNINNFTFDSIRTLMLLGFEEDVIAAFIGQDIILDYVEKMANSQSSLNESRITESDVIDTLLEKYKTGVRDNDLADSGVETLMKFIENGRSEPNYNAAQLAILDKFQYLSEYGKKLQGIQSALNTDSKGVGKSLLESEIKQEQLINNVLLENGSGRGIKNAKTLFGNYSNREYEGSFYLGERTVYVKGEKTKMSVYANGETINGFASTHSLSITNLLFKKAVPYSSYGFNVISKELEKVIGRKGKQFLKEVFNAAKSWVLSSAISQEEDLTTERKRLFFDEYEKVDGKLTLLKPSLATIAKEAQRQFGTNIFLQRLSFEPNTNGEPSLIGFKGAFGENYDETAIYAAFVGLFTENAEIKGTDYTTRQLAEDLVKYAYLAGGVQGSVQFIKYIPIEYLVNRKFGDVVRGYNWENPEVFGEEGTGQYEVRPFVKQFIQHNPWQTPKFELKQTIKANSTNPDAVTIFYPSENMVIQGEEGVAFPVFVRLEGKKGTNLFQFDGEKYNKIDTLGRYGMLEYNSTAKDTPSLIKSNQTVNTSVSQVPSKPVNPTPVKVVNERTRRLETSDVKQVLTSIVQNTTNGQYSNYASKLLEVVYKFNIHISANPNLPTSGKTIYQGSSSFVVINPNQQVHELEKAILHELTHAVTAGVINQYNSDKAFLSQSMLSKVERLDKFYQTFVERVGKDKIEQMLQTLQAKGEFDSKEQRDILYGGKNLKEFVALAMTSPDFQDFMKNNLWSEDTNKTLWQKFVEYVQGILTELGVKWGQDINPIIHQDILSIIQEQVEDTPTLEDLLQPTGTLWDIHSATILAKYPDITERDFNQLDEEEQQNFINCL